MDWQLKSVRCKVPFMEGRLLLQSDLFYIDFIPFCNSSQRAYEQTHSKRVIKQQHTASLISHKLNCLSRHFEVYVCHFGEFY